MPRLPRVNRNASDHSNNSLRPGSGVGARSASNRSALSRNATSKRYGKAEEYEKMLAETFTTPDYSFEGSTLIQETGELVIKLTNTKFNSLNDEPFDSVGLFELDPTNGVVPVSGDVDLMLPMSNRYELSVTRDSNGVPTITNSPALPYNGSVTFRTMAKFEYGKKYSVVASKKNSSTDNYSSFTFDYIYTAGSPKADYKVTGNYDSDEKKVSLTIKNIGRVKTTPNPYCYSNIFEVTLDKSSSLDVQNLEAETPLYSYLDKESKTVYPLSSGNYGITELEVTSVSSTNVSYNVVSSLSSSNNSYFRFTPALEPFDSVEISFKGNFESGKLYLFNADEILYYGSIKAGDTAEMIDDYDNPSNNSFLFTVPTNATNANDTELRVLRDGEMRPGTYTIALSDKNTYTSLDFAMVNGSFEGATMTVAVEDTEESYNDDSIDWDYSESMTISATRDGEEVSNAGVSLGFDPVSETWKQVNVDEFGNPELGAFMDVGYYDYGMTPAEWTAKPASPQSESYYVSFGYQDSGAAVSYSTDGYLINVMGYSQEQVDNRQEGITLSFSF